MDDELKRHSHKNTSLSSNSRFYDGAAYTGRLGESAATVAKRIYVRNAKQNRTQAFVIAQRKAKQAGEARFTTAIPSLDHEQGYRLGPLAEVHSALRPPELCKLWFDYCDKHAASSEVKDEQKETAAVFKPKIINVEVMHGETNKLSFVSRVEKALRWVKAFLRP